MSDSPKTRASLILRLRSNEDAEAWEEFAEIYQPLVFRIARSKGLQQADAFDVSQEVLVRVAKSIGQWETNEDRGTFRGWISRIARNLVIDFLRQQNRLPKSGNNTEVQKFSEGIAEDEASRCFDAEYERQIFAWAADKVRPMFETKTWQAFWLTTVENKSINEVGNQLEMSRGAIYIARSRVMAKLKATVERIEFETGSRVEK